MYLVRKNVSENSSPWNFTILSNEVLISDHIWSHPK